jgi:hypothetical protein
VGAAAGMAGGRVQEVWGRGCHDAAAMTQSGGRRGYRDARSHTHVHWAALDTQTEALQETHTRGKLIQLRRGALRGPKGLSIVAAWRGPVGIPAAWKVVHQGIPTGKTFTCRISREKKNSTVEAWPRRPGVQLNTARKIP